MAAVGPGEVRAVGGADGAAAGSDSRGGSGVQQGEQLAVPRPGAFELGDLLQVLTPLLAYPSVEWDAQQLCWTAYAPAPLRTTSSSLAAQHAPQAPVRPSTQLDAGALQPAVRVVLPRLAPRPGGFGRSGGWRQRDALEGWELEGAAGGGALTRGSPGASSGSSGDATDLGAYLQLLRDRVEGRSAGRVSDTGAAVGEGGEDAAAGLWVTGWEEEGQWWAEGGEGEEGEQGGEAEDDWLLDTDEEEVGCGELVPAGGALAGAPLDAPAGSQAAAQGQSQLPADGPPREEPEHILQPEQERQPGSSAAHVGSPSKQRPQHPQQGRRAGGELLPADCCLVLLSADSAALGVWAAGRLVRHKVLTGYTVRHSAGGSQARHDRTGGGARSVGAQLRRAEAARLWQATASKLAEWGRELARCELLVRSGDTRVWAQLYDARSPPPPVAQRDPRWERLGASVPRPRHRDLLAAHRQLCRGRVEVLLGA